eukprot:NODE_1168_length_973_cov_22.822695_g1123_i0.p1 GENE.NODE_1168_length_973_cov_22.822695_g1123_i0~~NODE_1168_length_973_cov_22.822695_g1123_i0.p1  ORF type:complete len:292 (+),score=36.58 NODE_1168_length_973_cov_22.822695_g1123_i0:71-946(+)
MLNSTLTRGRDTHSACRTNKRSRTAAGLSRLPKRRSATPHSARGDYYSKYNADMNSNAAPMYTPPPARTPRSIFLPADKDMPLIASQHKGDHAKLTVVLDLDETLVHSYQAPASAADPDALFFNSPELGDHWVNVRWGVDDILSAVGHWCEGVLWTAGTQAYADRVIRTLDPTHCLKHRIFRTDAWYDNSGAKRLERLGRDMDRTILIDNSPASIAENSSNSIVVKDFLNDMSDDTLHMLQHIIQDMSASRLTVPQYLASCSFLQRQRFPGRSRGWYYYLAPTSDRRLGSP